MPPLITIPAGTYPIGSDAPDAYTDESPAHELTLPAYRIGQFPVTNAEYACFVEAGLRRGALVGDGGFAGVAAGGEASVRAGGTRVHAASRGTVIVGVGCLGITRSSKEP
ncbi:MAG: SUMF1/EgtB/PvdO family nonheme iron enzyme [Ardenticatenia bacterium]|nr:SUMF1/EgtB/PvdO family nonheme iron enzyme [Ardenticatenia bacterium]